MAKFELGQEVYYIKGDTLANIIGVAINAKGTFYDIDTHARWRNEVRVVESEISADFASAAGVVEEAAQKRYEADVAKAERIRSRALSKAAQLRMNASEVQVG